MLSGSPRVPMAGQSQMGWECDMSPEVWHAVWFTLAVAALSTVCILPFATAMAWLLARHNWRGKPLVETFVALPLVMPPVATGLILLKLLGRRGPVGAFLHERLHVDIIFTWKAVLIAVAVTSFPLLVRTARVGFEAVAREYEDAARCEGASAWQIFLRITLPLAMRGIAAGAVLAFSRALGEFGATILVAGNIPGRTTTLAVAIYQNVQLGQDADAFHLLAISVAMAFGALWLHEALLARYESAHVP
jgi:molybdate transport system permease protein